MRIIGNIPNPHLKISVFKNDGRLSIKFENEGYEITFKMGNDERFQSLEDVEKWLDDIILEEVLANFQAIHGIRLRGMQRHFAVENEVFEEII